MGPKRLEFAVARDVPETGECVVLDPRQGRIVALNAMGAAVWDLLDGSREAAQVVDVVVQATGAPRADVERDVAALLERLEGEGFLEPDPGASRGRLTA